MPRAGLTPASVTEAAAVLADETGLEGLNMGLLAERLGIKTPSLYKHVGGLADLTHRIAVQAMTELADALAEATQGRSGTDALAAAAQAMRSYIKQHPGRYAAGNAAHPTGPGDPLLPAVDRVLHSLSATLRGYGIAADQEVHAMRMVRSMLHGFATFEATGGFMIDTPVDESFDWMIALVDRGLRESAGTSAQVGT